MFPLPGAALRVSARKELKPQHQSADIQPLWDTVNNHVRHSHNFARIKVEFVEYSGVWDPQFLTVGNHVNRRSATFC